MSDELLPLEQEDIELDNWLKKLRETPAPPTPEKTEIDIEEWAKSLIPVKAEDVVLLERQKDAIQKAMQASIEKGESFMPVVDYAMKEFGFTFEQTQQWLPEEMRAKPSELDTFHTFQKIADKSAHPKRLKLEEASTAELYEELNREYEANKRIKTRSRKRQEETINAIAEKESWLPGTLAKMTTTGGDEGAKELLKKHEEEWNRKAVDPLIERDKKFAEEGLINKVRFTPLSPEVIGKVIKVAGASPDEAATLAKQEGIREHPQVRQVLGQAAKSLDEDFEKALAKGFKPLEDAVNTKAGQIGLKEWASKKKWEENIPVFGGVISAKDSVLAYNAIQILKDMNSGERAKNPVLAEYATKELTNFIAPLIEAEKRGLSFAAGTANTVADSATYAAEFMLAGGMGRSLSTGVKTALRRIVKKTAARGAKRLIGGVAEGVVKGAIVSTTVQATRTAADAVQRAMPTVSYDKDKGLQVAEGERPIAAGLKAIASATIQNAAEFAGAGLARGAAKLFGKKTATGSATFLKKFTTWLAAHPPKGSAAQKASNALIKAIKGADYALSLAKYDGPLEEIGEEHLGMAVEALLGTSDSGLKGKDNTLFNRMIASIPSLKEELQMALAFTLPGAAKSSLHLGAKAMQHAYTHVEERNIEKFIASPSRATAAKLPVYLTDIAKGAGMDLKRHVHRAALAEALRPQEEAPVVEEASVEEVTLLDKKAEALEAIKAKEPRLRNAEAVAAAITEGKEVPAEIMDKHPEVKMWADEKIRLPFPDYVTSLRIIEAVPELGELPRTVNKELDKQKDIEYAKIEAEKHAKETDAFVEALQKGDLDYVKTWFADASAEDIGVDGGGSGETPGPESSGKVAPRVAGPVQGPDGSQSRGEDQSAVVEPAPKGDELHVAPPGEDSGQGKTAPGDKRSVSVPDGEVVEETEAGTKIGVTNEKRSGDSGEGDTADGDVLGGVEGPGIKTPGGKAADPDVRGVKPRTEGGSGERGVQPKAVGVGGQQTAGEFGKEAGVGTSDTMVSTPVEHDSVPRETSKAPVDASGKNTNLGGKGNITLTRGERKSINEEAKRILEKSPEEITEEDKEVLRQYTGEGGLGKATVGSLNQHYTSYEVIKAVYNALDRSGFKGVTALEPAVGSGNFVGLRPGYQWTTVDIDETNHRVVSALYPSANNYHMGFENFTGDGFDLVVSNVPFMETRTVTGKKAARKDVKALHDFFFVHALDRVKEDGLVVFITSTGTMDKKDSSIREEIVSKADVIGAYRLPGGTFSGNAHTDVITDMIVLQKRPGGVTARERYQRSNAAFVESAPTADDIHMNRYYEEHPANVLGNLVPGVNKLYGGRKAYELHGEADLDSISFEYTPYGSTKQEETPIGETYPEFLVRAGKEGIRFRESGTPRYGENVDIVDGVVFVAGKERSFKDVKKTLKEYTSSTSPEVGKILLLDKLKLAIDNYQNTQDEKYSAEGSTLIDEYKEKFGRHPSADRKLKAFFKKHNAVTHGLELAAGIGSDFTLPDSLVEKTRHAGGGKQAVDSTSSLKERALAQEDHHGVLTTGNGISLEDLPDLLTNGYALVSHDGETATLQNDILYYAGNMYERADKARSLLKKVGDELEPLVESQLAQIDANTPEGKSWADLRIRGNEPWLMTTLEELGIPLVSPVTNKTTGKREFLPAKLALQEIFGGLNSVADIYKNYLNNRALIRRIEGESVVSFLARMQGAEETLFSILGKLKDFIHERGLSEKVREAYNRSFRGYKKPDYVKASYLIREALAEANKNSGQPLRKNQIAWITQAVYEGRGINAHDVGGGKTRAAITLARAMKQRGMAKKPLFVVPANTIENWVRETKLLFPNAKIINLINLSADNRGKQLFELANSNADYVFMSREGFSSVQLPEEDEVRYMREVLDRHLNARGTTRGRARIQEKKEDLLDVIRSKPRTSRVTLDKLGVDAIIADEAHAYKNIGVPSSLARYGLGKAVAINSEGTALNSSRSYDFSFKANWVSAHNNARNVFLLTATPTPNKPLEIYTMLNHLSPDILHEYGIFSAEDFANQFMRIGAVRVPGEDKTKQILKAFVNAVELRGILNRYVDRIAMEDMKYITVPGAEMLDHILSLSETYEQIEVDLQGRISGVSGGITGKGEDSITAIYTNGRSGSVDPRLYGGDHAKVAVDHRTFDEDTDKVEWTINAVTEVAENNKNAGQLIFLDATGHTQKLRGAMDADLHTEIKASLIARGFKPEEIAIINGKVITDARGEETTSGKASDKKIAIADAYNAGKIRVVIGTTSSMGEGMNLQVKTTDIYHMDIPFTPGAIRQRNGRGVRYGNENNTVRVHMLLMEGTFDSLSLGLILNKKGWNEALWDKDLEDEISVEEEMAGGALPQAKEVMIALEKNPVRKRQMQVEFTKEAKKEDLYSLKCEVRRAKTRIVTVREELSTAETKLQERKKLLEEHAPNEKIKDEKKRGETFEKSKLAKEKSIAVIESHIASIKERLGTLRKQEEERRALLATTIQEYEDFIKENYDESGEVITVINEMPPPQEGTNAFSWVYQGETVKANAFEADTGAGVKALDLAEMVMLVGGETIKIKPRLRGDVQGRFKGAIELKADISIGPVITAVSCSVKHAAKTLTKALTSVLTRFPELKAEDVTYRIRKNKGKALITIYRKDATYAPKVLAHEIGHWNDMFAGKKHTLRRGNILGHIAALHAFRKVFMSTVKNTQEEALPKRTRDKLRRLAQKKYPDSLKGVKTEYQKLIRQYCAANIILSKEQLDAELQQLTRWWNPFDPDANEKYTKYRFSPAELYAEAISVLLNAPGEVQKRAPMFYKGFFANLEAHDKFKKAYESIQRLLGRGAKARMGQFRAKVRDSMQRGLEKRREQDKKGTSYIGWLDMFVSHFLDPHWVIKKLYHNAKRKREDVVNPEEAIEFATYSGTEGELYSNRMTGEIKMQLQEEGLSAEDLSELMFHSRVVSEKGEKFSPHGATVKKSTAALEDMRRQLGSKAFAALERIRQNFWDIRKETVVKKLVDAGMYSTALENALENNEMYATYQVVEYLDNTFGKGSGERIFGRVGTVKGVSDVLTETMRKDVALMRAADLNTAKQITVEFLQKEHPELIEKAEHIQSGKKSVPKAPHDKTKGAVSYMEKGEIKAFYVPKMIAEGFSSPSWDIGPWAAILSWSATPFRYMFTVLRPGFWMRNGPRDYFRLLKNLPGSGLALTKEYIKSIPPSFQSLFTGEEADIIAEMQEAHLLIGISRINDLHGEERESEVALRKMYADPRAFKEAVIKPLRWAFNKFMGISEAIERVPKIAAYTHLNNLGVSEEKRNHLVRTAAGSPAFLIKGRSAPVTNQILLFSNAILQSWRSDMEQLRERPGEVFLKTMGYSVVPKMLQVALSAGLAVKMAEALGFGDEDDTLIWLKKQEEMYSRITEYQKENYLCIPLGEAPGNKTVFLRIPQDEQQRFLNALLHKAVSGTSQEDMASTVQNMMSYGADQGPGVSPLIKASYSAAQYYLFGQNPYDAFRQRNVIRTADFTVDKGQNKYAREQVHKWLWNTLGLGVIHKFQYDNPYDIAGELETLVEAPGISDTIGGFLKVSGYGLIEKQRRDEEAAKMPIKRQRQKARHGAYKLLGTGEVAPEEKEAMESMPKYTRRYLNSLRKRLRKSSPSLQKK